MTHRFPLMNFSAPALILLVALFAGAAGPVHATKDRPDAASREAQAMSEYATGVLLLESESARDAIPHLENAWELSGGDEVIGQKLAEAYFDVGDLAACSRVVDGVLAKAPQNGGAWFLKAKVTYLTGERETSLEQFEQARAHSEPSFDLERLIGKIAEELGRDEKAIEAYRAALKLDPDQFGLQHSYGLLLEKHGRFEEAEAAYRAALAAEPRYADPALALANLLTEQGRSADAEAVLRTLLSSDPGNTDAVMGLASAYMRQGKLDDAIRLVESTGPRTSMEPELLLFLGRLYYEAKEYGEALSIFESIYRGGAESAELARALGEVSLRAGNPDAALGYYREAIRIAPADYRSYLALFFASSDRFSQAGEASIGLTAKERRELLDQAGARVGDDDFDAIYVLGVSYESFESYGEAREYLEKAVELRPRDERALLNLAAVLEKTEKYGEAERHLATLYEMKPDDPTICNFYGYLLALMSKDLGRAEELVRKALAHEPNNGYYLDSLGWVYYKRGELERAVAELEKAAGVVGSDATILEHLGDAYRSVERYQDALAAYERSRELQGKDAANLDDLEDKIDAARKKIGR